MLAWQIHAIMIMGLFTIGAVVGSFLNVCIYRIPWEKSLIWPASHCPRCFTAIAPQDNLPIISWLSLRGECRTCGLPISARYPSIEALVGVLFASVYVVQILYGKPIPWGDIPNEMPIGVLYYLLFVSLLVTATFIDYDLTIIPDIVTVPGMVIGIAVGAFYPEIRSTPSSWPGMSHWDGLWVGVIGLLVGGGITQGFRLAGSLALRREAMGFGDVTLMAMIGAFLGWQAAVLTFFIGPFFGLGHALMKMLVFIGKKLRGVKSSAADREIPFGPYLSMGALAMLYSWPWFWPGWAKQNFDLLRMVFSPL